MRIWNKNQFSNFKMRSMFLFIHTRLHYRSIPKLYYPRNQINKNVFVIFRILILNINWFNIQSFCNLLETSVSYKVYLPTHRYPSKTHSFFYLYFLKDELYLKHLIKSFAFLFLHTNQVAFNINLDIFSLYIF